ncbi:hypothetical protein D9611_012543 [Ephemerocybe angulata]|uniref:Uncharacterized protein n=1 Tax=Ephemerocybe angulata TaxID=980116 RepID=A0A8H5ET42_9AGAR|nr:hypothetical protein D9611_012543 [Tulosesus angulatus]
MKFTIAPLVGLLFGASCLIANTTAYSYEDYNELDARQQIDDALSERGFGLEARETVDVPFQPSLRAFLGEAVTAYRRSTNGYEENLDARGAPVYWKLTILHPMWDATKNAMVDGKLEVKIGPGAHVSTLKKQVLEDLYNKGYTLINTRGGKRLEEGKSLSVEGVNSGDTLRLAF